MNSTNEKVEEWCFIPKDVGCNELGEEIAGWSIFEQPENIVVVVKIYKESERKYTIAKMTEFLLMRNYNRRVYIIDSEEYEREMRKYNPDESKFDEFGQQMVYYEFTDLITDRYVPLMLIAYKQKKEDKK